MMTTTIQAVYERSGFRLKHALPLEEGTEVTLTVAAPEPIAAPPRHRFTWEDAPILAGDGTPLLTDELRRQRDEE
jgi:antitoxin component of MazEF toxin-antitoxin module